MQHGQRLSQQQTKNKNKNHLKVTEKAHTHTHTDTNKKENKLNSNILFCLIVFCRRVSFYFTLLLVSMYIGCAKQKGGRQLTLS